MLFAFIGNIGTWEILVILFVALLVFGPGKLPEVARTIGKTLGEIKKVTSGVQKEFQDALTLETENDDKKDAAKTVNNKSNENQTTQEEPDTETAGEETTDSTVEVDKETIDSAVEVGNENKQQEEPEWVTYSRVNSEPTEDTEELNKPS